MTTGTTVWISGASSGIGAALVRTMPYDGARLINLDVRQAELVETILFDLTRPETWPEIDRHFKAELARPELRQAIFLHCAYAPVGKGLVDKVEPAAYERSLIANAAGVPAIAASFLRHLRPDVDAGLMVMSSGAAAARLPGYTVYAGSKAGVEHWVRIARTEIRQRGWGPWVVSLRPGLVRTETAAAAATLDSATFPLGAQMARDLKKFGVDADVAAARIWSCLPPAAGAGALIDLATVNVSEQR